MLHGKRILFLTACFFGYEKAIISRLQELGASVDFYDERPSNSILGKGLIRVYPKLIQNRIHSYYQKILDETRNQNYDYFLLIKGEATPFSFLEEFSKQHPNTKRIFYMYDSVAEYPKFLDLAPYFHRCFSFELSDVLKYGFHFRPTFFTNSYTPKTSDKKIYDIVFIGSAHTDRYTVGEKIKSIAERQHLKTYFYYFAPGRIAFWMKRIFDPNFKKFNYKKLSFSPLSHKEIAELYHQTFAVLDINKPFQFGLGMRIFEVLSSHTKLITTNPEIEKYPFYSSQNIAIVDRTSPVLPKDFFQTPFQKIDPKDLEMMSLDSWIEALFLQDQDAYWLQKVKMKSV